MIMCLFAVGSQARHLTGQAGTLTECTGAGRPVLGARPTAAVPCSPLSGPGRGLAGMRPRVADVRGL